jgi:hypothetical protein
MLFRRFHINRTNSVYCKIEQIFHKCYKVPAALGSLDVSVPATGPMVAARRGRWVFMGHP